MGKFWVYSTYGQFTREHKNFSYIFSVNAAVRTAQLFINDYCLSHLLHLWQHVKMVKRNLELI